MAWSASSLGFGQPLQMSNPNQDMLDQLKRQQQSQPHGNFLTHLLPTVGSIIGGVGGTLLAPVAGTAAGGMAGGALGTLLENKLEGNSAGTNLALNTGLGALGGVGKLAKGAIGAGQALRAGEGAAAAGNVLRFGTKGAAAIGAEGTTGLMPQAMLATNANAGKGLLGKMSGAADQFGKQAMVAQAGTMGKGTAESAARDIQGLRNLGYSSFDKAASHAPAITGPNGALTVARQSLVNNPKLGGIDTSNFQAGVKDLVSKQTDLSPSSQKNILSLVKNVADKYNFEGTGATTNQYGKIGISHPSQLNGAIGELQTAAYNSAANTPERKVLVNVVNSLKAPLDNALAPLGIGDNIKAQAINVLKQQGVDNPKVLGAVQNANSYRDLAQLESKFVTASKVAQEGQVNALRGGIPGLAASGKPTLTGMLNQMAGGAVEKGVSKAGGVAGSLAKTPGEVTTPTALIGQTAKSIGKAQALPAFARETSPQQSSPQSLLQQPNQNTTGNLLGQTNQPQGGDLMSQLLGQPQQSQASSGMTLDSLQSALKQDYIDTGGKNSAALMNLAQLSGLVDDKGNPTNGKPKLSTAQQTNLDGLNQAAATLGAYYQQLQSAGGGQGVAIGPVQSLLGKVGLGGDQAKNARAVEQTRIDVATTLARAMTGNSRPAQQQIESWKQSIPNITDPQGVAQQKLQNLMQLIQARTQVYSGQSNDLLSHLNGVQ